MQCVMPKLINYFLWCTAKSCTKLEFSVDISETANSIASKLPVGWTTVVGWNSWNDVSIWHHRHRIQRSEFKFWTFSLIQRSRITWSLWNLIAYCVLDERDLRKKYHKLYILRRFYTKKKLFGLLSRMEEQFFKIRIGRKAPSTSESFRIK